MAFKDLRSFLAKLEEENQLVRYTDKILPTPGIGQISSAISKMGHNGPAVLFDNIAGYKGQRLVVGVHGSWANHALMLDMPKSSSIRDQFFDLSEKWDKYPGEVTFVDDAPCQEVVIEEDDINLYQDLPLYRINALDGGCYISKAAVVTREPYDPDNLDAVNVGTYRLQVQGKNTIGLQLHNFHDGGEHYAQAEKESENLPVCICLGNDPLLSFMASTPIAYDQSEYKYVAGMGGFTYELTRSTLAGLPIPARSEFILEGEIIPHKRVVEGPFGEFPGSYSGVRSQQQIVIKRITHRVDPIFENLYIGFPFTEADVLLGLNTCVPLYKQLKDRFPVKAVNALYQHGLTCIVATDQKFACQSKSIAFAVASTPHGQAYCRTIILVDGHVDPFDLTQVMWALSTRVRPGEDVVEIPNCPGQPLNPSDKVPGIDRKLIIDATTPVYPDKIRESKLIAVDPAVHDWVKVLGEMQAAQAK